MTTDTEGKSVAQADVVKIAGKSSEYAVARAELDPEMRHAVNALNASGDLFSGDRADVTDIAEAMGDIADAVAAKDMSVVSRLLTAQALSLDSLFTQMVRKAHANMGQHSEAFDRYMRVGLKAQAQSRATLEAIVKMHQPREQTVRHVHVGPNGQAVFVESMHGGFGNGRSGERALAPSEDGPALLSHDPQGFGVPVPGGEGEASVPNARRRGRQRRPAGE